MEDSCSLILRVPPKETPHQPNTMAETNTTINSHKASPNLRLESSPPLLLCLGTTPSCWTPRIEDEGKPPTGETFCCSILPEPTIMGTPMEGIPFTTTKMSAGPGARMAGLGGSWETCKTAVTFLYPVYVDWSWT
jgi:hypothetical protein